jgi:hypothetical protein
MGLVQNLKRTLANWADKILVELSCLYIKQVAKQTLKRQDNSLSTESLPNHLTQEDLPTTIATSSVGTSEKTIMMETEETVDIVDKVREWAMERMFSMTKSSETTHHQLLDARSLANEFEEWFDDTSLDDLEVMVIEEEI